MTKSIQEQIAEAIYEAQRQDGDEWAIAKANVYIYERYTNLADAVIAALSKIDVGMPSVEEWRGEFQYLLNEKKLTRDELAYLFGQIKSLIDRQKNLCQPLLLAKQAQLEEAQKEIAELKNQLHSLQEDVLVPQEEILQKAQAEVENLRKEIERLKNG